MFSVGVYFSERPQQYGRLMRCNRNEGDDDEFRVKADAGVWCESFVSLIRGTSQYKRSISLLLTRGRDGGFAIAISDGRAWILRPHRQGLVTR